LTVDAQGGVWVQGGEHLDRLIITTSRQDLAADAEPLAGAGFSYLAGVPDARCVRTSAEPAATWASTGTPEACR
jgi:hypothetical protein